LDGKLRVTKYILRQGSYRAEVNVKIEILKLEFSNTVFILLCTS
jgi:hypothetical protein